MSDILCDLRTDNVNKYVLITHREGGKTIKEEHWIFPNEHNKKVLKWETNSYLPGRGLLQIGDRVVYKGKNFPGSKIYVEDVAIGTTATVLYDYGYDYRYELRFDEPTAFHIWSAFPDGQYPDRKSIRTNGAGWERV